VKTGTMQGVLDGFAAATDYYTAVGAAPGDDAVHDATANALATSTYLKTAAFRTEWEEELDMYGIGFNTELLGWGFQGEASHRRDVPLQIDDTELLFAAVGTMLGFNPATAALAGANQVGDFTGQTDTWITGGVKKDITQIQITVSKLFGSILGGDGSAFVAEAGLHHIHGMPGKDEMRFETYGPYGTGNAVMGPVFSVELEDGDMFPDANSWGYVLYGQLDYKNLIGPVRVSPRMAWSHDVSGISPNGGPFVEGRKSLMVGVEFGYLINLTCDISYTNFLGGGKRNQLNDRDFVSANIKYTF
jgi:hypothetical protein